MCLRAHHLLVYTLWHVIVEFLYYYNQRHELVAEVE